MRAIWCVAVLAATLHGQDRQPGKGVNFYSKEKEIALGQQLASEMRRHTTPLDNAAAVAYVKRVGASLAAQMSGGWTFQFEVTQDDGGGSTHEPVALPGGYIFVSQYLIGAARSEAEFAGMLAHAMAHVEARHGTRQATKGSLMQIGTLASGTSNTGQPVPMGFIAFQRAFESEADFLGVQAMAAAGYDPAGLASYIERLQVPRDKNTVFETTPDRDVRVAAIRREIAKLPARPYPNASGEFEQVQASLK